MLTPLPRRALRRYHDMGDSPRFEVFPFSTDVAAVQSQMQGVYARGGADEPEVRCSGGPHSYDGGPHPRGAAGSNAGTAQHHGFPHAHSTRAQVQGPCCRSPHWLDRRKRLSPRSLLSSHSCHGGGSEHARLSPHRSMRIGELGASAHSPPSLHQPGRPRRHHRPTRPTAIWPGPADRCACIASSAPCDDSDGAALPIQHQRVARAQ